MFLRLLLLWLAFYHVVVAAADVFGNVEIIDDFAVVAVDVAFAVVVDVDVVVAVAEVPDIKSHFSLVEIPTRLFICLLLAAYGRMGPIR